MNDETSASSDSPAPNPAPPAPEPEGGIPSSGAPAAAPGEAGAGTDSSPPPPAPAADGSTPSDAAPATPSPAPGFLEKLPWWTVPVILLGVPALFALVALLVPGFFDHVIWRYYWGPIKADAIGLGGSTPYFDDHRVPAFSGYNLVNTASWALLLAVCLVGIAQILRRTRTPMDATLIVGATGWVVAGSVFHVMEDTGLFATPLQYFFITPPIYLMFGAAGVASLGIGLYLRRVQEQAGLDRALQKLWFILAIQVLVYLAMWLKPWSQVLHYLNPVWVALAALATYAIAVWRFQRLGRIVAAELVSILSVGWILLGVAYTFLFAADPWMPQAPVLAALWAPVLAALVAAAMFGLALLMVGRAERSGKTKRRDFWFAFFNPMNLLLLFSQMLDGFATAIGIDAGGYSEKHVLSKALIDVTRNAGERFDIGFLADYPTLFGFTTVKFAISLLVISAIENSARTEGERQGPLIGLVRFAIIMVGIGPGIRDFVRMALGV